LETATSRTEPNAPNGTVWAVEAVEIVRP
jgi:hypothetical protein